MQLILALALILSACATAREGSSIRGPYLVGAGAANHNYRVDGPDIFGPGGQLTHYDSTIRGLLHGKGVEVTITREGEHERVIGMWGGRLVSLFIETDSTDTTEIEGSAGGRRVALRLSKHELVGRAGCTYYALESQDGQRYTPRHIADSQAWGFHIPRELKQAWGDDAAHAVLALLFTTHCGRTGTLASIPLHSRF